MSDHFTQENANILRRKPEVDKVRAIRGFDDVYIGDSGAIYSKRGTALKIYGGEFVRIRGKRTNLVDLVAEGEYLVPVRAQYTVLGERFTADRYGTGRPTMSEMRAIQRVRLTKRVGAEKAEKILEAREEIQRQKRKRYEDKLKLCLKMSHLITSL